MSRYVFIESRDPFTSKDTSFVSDTASELSRNGHDVYVYLVQNGVLTGRTTARGSHISKMAEAGVTLLTDDFSLCERGISVGELNPAIKPCEIEELVDLIVQEDTKAMWH